MYKLDPVERLPDGTFFRLTPGQAEKRSVRQALDGVKSGHRYPPLQSASRPPDCRW